jgi:hypothetical protein
VRDEKKLMSEVLALVPEEYREWAERACGRGKSVCRNRSPPYPLCNPKTLEDWWDKLWHLMFGEQLRPEYVPHAACWGVNNDGVVVLPRQLGGR